MIVPPNKPETNPVPEDVGTARQLWWGVAGLGVVYTGAGIVTMLGDRDELEKQLLEEAYKTDPDLPAATADLIVPVFVGLTGVVGLLLAGLTVLIAHQLGRGKSWARTVLTIVAVWLGVGAVATMFTFDGDGGPASMVSGAIAIVQGVLAVGAAYLSYRPESTKYFQPNRR
ncbi:hypothetical protein ACFO5K_17180 [Nocardia halotolerans]|uniref:Integral membrane protein n=1 Tax=Nocardia halotolerans TaxID=1755878 RepID=A0ABV8VIJ3_9NOCA